jgi:hypothetical protein
LQSINSAKHISSNYFITRLSYIQFYQSMTLRFLLSLAIHLGICKAQAYEKKWRFYFLFILERTTKKSILFMNNPVFLFWFFPCCCFGFIGKAATTKNRQFIYDLSMLCLGLGYLISLYFFLLQLMLIM